MRRQFPKAARKDIPLWFSAAHYYLIVGAIAIGVFLLTWVIFREEGETGETSWIVAGLFASVVLIASILLREVLLRKTRQRILAEHRLDRSLKQMSAQIVSNPNPGKFTLDQNDAILKLIKTKSDAAKVLDKFAGGHREVVELCQAYFGVVTQEVPNIGVGSPRLPALRKGNRLAQKFHRYHLLKLTEVEVTALTKQAELMTDAAEKANVIRQAQGLIEQALYYYPDDRHLLDSNAVLVNHLGAIVVSDLIRRGDDNHIQGNFARALEFYHDALFELDADNGLDESKISVEKSIKAKIDEIISKRKGELDIAELNASDKLIL